MPRAVAALILVCLSAFASERGKAGVASGFHFEVEPIVTGDDAQADALRRAVVDLWQDYLRMDAPGHAARFAPDAIRLSARSAERQSGRAAVQAGLASEWQAFERPGGRIAEQMTVERSRRSTMSRASMSSLAMPRSSAATAKAT